VKRKSFAIEILLKKDGRVANFGSSANALADGWEPADSCEFVALQVASLTQRQSAF
jgi:hypothetical protein